MKTAYETLKPYESLRGIHHHGDCNWYQCKICTCGLLHFLLPMEDAADLFEDFNEQFSEHEENCRKMQDLLRKARK